jgi:hypothetical protein
MGSSLKSAQFLIESRIRDAAHGDAGACYDLGMVFSSGADGVGLDLIEAHKWFNIAEISEDMSAREIIAAQKAARDWLHTTQRRAA